MKFKALLLLLVTSVSFLRTMEPDPNAVAQAKQKDPLRSEGFYTSWLPQDLYRELLKFKRNGKHHLAINFWLMKHREKNGFVSTPKRFKAAYLHSIDPKNKRLLLHTIPKDSLAIWNMATKQCESENEYNVSNKYAEYFLPYFDYENSHYFSYNPFNPEINCVDLATQAQKKVYEGRIGAIKNFIVDSNRKIIIAHYIRLTESCVTIWNTETGESKVLLQTGTAFQQINAMAYNPCLGHLFILFENGSVQIWDLKLSKCVKVLYVGVWVEHLFFNANYTQLVSVNIDGHIEWRDLTSMFTVADPKKWNIFCIKTFNTNQRILSNCLFDFDNNLFFFISTQQKTINVIDLENGICIQRIPIRGLRDTLIFDDTHNCLYTNCSNLGLLEIFELNDPLMKKEIWNQMGVYKLLLFEKAYKVWLANKKSKKNSALWNTFTFAGSECLDLTSEPLLYKAFCQLPEAMQQVMREHISIFYSSVLPQ